MKAALVAGRSHAPLHLHQHVTGAQHVSVSAQNRQGQPGRPPCAGMHVCCDRSRSALQPTNVDRPKASDCMLLYAPYAPEKTHLPSHPARARAPRRSKDPCAGGGGASTAAPHDGGRAPTRVRPGATGPEAGLCPRRSGPLSLHLAHPCDMCARGRRPSDERRLIGRLTRRRVPKDLRSAGSGMI